jgi:hypothetical protein
LDALKLPFLKETISLCFYLEQHQAAEKLLQSEDEKIFTATKKILLELYSDIGKRGLCFCLCRSKRLNQPFATFLLIPQIYLTTLIGKT